MLPKVWVMLTTLPSRSATTKWGGVLPVSGLFPRRRQLEVCVLRCAGGRGQRRVDVGGLIGEVFFGEDGVEGRRLHLRVGGVLVALVEGLLRYPGVEVEVGGAVLAEGGRIELAHYPEARQIIPGGVGRRRGGYPRSLVVDADGRFPLGAVALQVLRGEKAAALLGARDYSLAELAAVDRTGPLLGDEA